MTNVAKAAPAGHAHQALKHHPANRAAPMIVAARGGGHRFRVAFNTNDLTLAPNKPCCKHRNFASA